MIRRFVIAWSIAVLFNLFGCAKPVPAEPVTTDAVPGRELYCLAESQTEAEEIASSYDITLVSFGDGVATFTTEKDLHEVIQYGKKNNLAPISINTATIQTYN